MKEIQAAIIGCGAIHGCHLNALRRLPGVRLRALVDSDGDKGQRLAAAQGCHFYHDYREMLLDEAIKVVHICTPHYLHQTMILDALAAGKHVFSEKPVAMNLLEAQAIRRAAARAPGLLGVCYQNRFNPGSQVIRRLLAESALGEMLSIKAVLTWSRGGDYYAASPWRGRYATEGGSLLINQAIHTLDLMQWFAGGAARVKGVVESSLLAGETEAEDTAMATLQFRNGARGLFYASNCHTLDSPLLLEIHCRRGMLQLQDNVLWQTVDGQRSQLVSDAAPDGDGKSYWGDGHQQAIRHFYAALRQPQQAEYTDIYQAEKSLAIVEGIYRSAQLRQWVTLAE